MGCFPEQPRKGNSLVPTLTRLFFGVNVVTLLVLLPVSLVLRSQVAQHSRQTENDVMKPNDVTGSHSDGLNGNYINRYCYKEEPSACEDKGLRVKKGDKGEDLCCGHLGNHLFDLMAQEVRDRLERDSRRGQVMQNIKNYIVKLNQDTEAAAVRPAAHVGILPNWNLTDPENRVPYIRWANSGDASVLTGGILHKGDRLEVRKTGYYFVYSGLQYNADQAMSEDGAIVSYLYRTVNGSEDSRQKLMMSRESSCRWSRGDSAKGPVSTHMAGIFLLRRHDEIGVRTSGYTLLEKAGTANYLGIHMV